MFGIKIFSKLKFKFCSRLSIAFAVNQYFHEHIYFTFFVNLVVSIM